MVFKKLAFVILNFFSFIVYAQEINFYNIASSHGSSSFAINATKEFVVGTFETTDGQNQAFLWSLENGMINITNLSEKVDQSIASAVSEDGALVFGGITAKDGVVTPFVWNKGHKWQVLASLVSNKCIPLDSDSSGDILVGECFDQTTNATQPFILKTNGKLISPSFVSDRNRGSAVAINSNGTVVVGNSLNQNNQTEAFAWTEKQGILGLGSLGKGSSAAYSMSKDGSVIVGGSFLDEEDSIQHAFYWQSKQGMKDLGTLGGSYSVATGVSPDVSMVVGYSENKIGEMEAFFWKKDTGMVSLKTYLLAKGLNVHNWKLSHAITFSKDSNMIIGNGINPKGKPEAWVVEGL